MLNRIFLGISVFSLILFVSCNKRNYFFLEGQTQGSFYHITYQGNTDFNSEIDSLLKVFDKSLNAWDSTSIISRINHNDTTVLADSLFISVFNKAKQVHDESNGMFDITVGPLVKAWGLYKKTKMLPDSASVKQLLTIVGMNKVKLIGNKIVKRNPGITLDVNAIAPGYSVDVVSGFLERKGIANYMVEIGGELKCKGKNPDGKDWRVGIDKPVDNENVPGEELQSTIQISGKAMATSGNYRRFVVENGIKYGHHLNPKTGYPSKNPLLSVTIVADDCISADAYATACIVSGLEGTKEFLEKHRELEAFLVYSGNNGDYKVYITGGLKNLVQK